jgi:type I restriction-modification system DNA methylase subunit
MEECNLHTIVRLPNSVFKPYASIGTNLLFFEKGTPTKDIWFYEHRVPEGQKAYSMTKPIRFEHLQGCIDWWGGAKRKSREGRGPLHESLLQKETLSFLARAMAMTRKLNCQSAGFGLPSKR